MTHEENAPTTDEATERDTDFRMIPPHTHTPDEVQWDSFDMDPTSDAKIGHVLAVHDRTTELSRRIIMLQQTQKRQAVALMFLAMSCVFLSLALRKAKHNA